MVFGSAGEGESDAHKRGDRPSRFENGENTRSAALRRQAEQRAEAAKMLERKKRGGNGRAQRFLGGMAVLDGVRIDLTDRFA